MKNNKIAWLLLIVLSLIWGSSFILIKRGLVSFSPIQIACIRVIAASLVLLIPAIKNIKHLKKHDLIYIIISGFVGSFIPALLFAIAQRKIPSSISGILNTLTPLFVAIIASIWFGFKLTQKIKMGLFCAFIGSIFLSLGKGEYGEAISPLYILLVVLACILYACLLYTSDAADD